MLLIGGRPLIGWTLEEARAAGVGRAVVVVHPRKRDLVDYLASAPLGPGFTVETVEQPEPIGCVDALQRGFEALGQDRALVLFPDHLCWPCGAAAAALLAAAERAPFDSMGLIALEPRQGPTFGRLCRARPQPTQATEPYPLSRLELAPGPHPLPTASVRWHTAVGGLYTADYFAAQRRAGGPRDELDLELKNQLAASGGLWGVPLPCALWDVGQPPGLRAARARFG